VLIDQKLCRVFGTDKVFRSSHAMHGGTSFPPTLAAEAAGCAVMLVVVGRHWLAATGAVRRIDDPEDWVRKEIELALAAGRPVIPVLAGDRLPLRDADRLPDPLAGLIERQHLRLNHEVDLALIADEIRQYLGGAGSTSPVHLISLQPTHRSADVRLGSAELGGAYHGSSIVFRPNLFATRVRGTIGFTLGMRYRTLEVTAGVLDDATEPNQVGVFTVIGDGRRLRQVTVTRDRPRVLTVDVTDVLHLKLEAYRPGTTARPAPAGGKAAKLPELAWGDPVVYP
jgi:hypothetical protein